MIDIPNSTCPSCGETLRSRFNSEIEAKEFPDPGDVTVCMHCGHLMVFAEDLTLRNPTDTEIIAMAGDPRILAVQAIRPRLDHAMCEIELRHLSEAYLRLRTKIPGAFDTPHAPTSKQIWDVTEQALDRLNAEYEVLKSFDQREGAA